MDLVLCVAEQTKIIPLSGSSKSFYQERKQKRLVEKTCTDVVSLTEVFPFHRCLRTDSTQRSFPPLYPAPLSPKRKYIPKTLRLSFPLFFAQTTPKHQNQTQQ